MWYVNFFVILMQRILFLSNSGARIQKGRSQPKPALQLAMQRMLQRCSWRSSERALAATRMQH